MNLSRMLGLLGNPTGRRIVIGAGRDGKRTRTSMLIWHCAGAPCEPVCVARNPVLMDLSMSTIPDNGLWTIEPCMRHAALFENENMG